MKHPWSSGSGEISITYYIDAGGIIEYFNKIELSRSRSVFSYYVDVSRWSCNVTTPAGTLSAIPIRSLRIQLICYWRNSLKPLTDKDEIVSCVVSCWFEDNARVRMNQTQVYEKSLIALPQFNYFISMILRPRKHVKYLQFFDFFWVPDSLGSNYTEFEAFDMFLFLG